MCIYIYIYIYIYSVERCRCEAAIPAAPAGRYCAVSASQPRQPPIRSPTPVSTLSNPHRTAPVNTSLDAFTPEHPTSTPEPPTFTPDPPTFTPEPPAHTSRRRRPAVRVGVESGGCAVYPYPACVLQTRV